MEEIKNNQVKEYLLFFSSKYDHFYNKKITANF